VERHDCSQPASPQTYRTKSKGQHATGGSRKQRA
jgi:hypothetical protein